MLQIKDTFFLKKKWFFKILQTDVIENTYFLVKLFSEIRIFNVKSQSFLFSKKIRKKGFVIDSVNSKKKYISCNT